MKQKIFTLLLFLQIFLVVQAQTMNVRSISGTRVVYDVVNIKKLTFADGNLVVTDNKGSSETFILSESGVIRFSWLPNGSLTFCKGATVDSAVGTTPLKFYSALSGGRLLDGASALATKTLYATETIYGVESRPRVPVSIIVNELPSDPIGAITSNTLISGNFKPAALAVGPYIQTNTTISYRVPEFLNAHSYLWTVPEDVHIVGQIKGTRKITQIGAKANILNLNFESINAGEGIVGAITIQAQNENGCAGTAKSITVSKVLPVAPSSIRMTNEASSLPLSGVRPAITTFAPHMGTNTELTLTAKPSLTATSYVWELPTGVNVTNGSATNVGGVTESTSNVITVNFSGVTNTNSFSYTTTAAVPVATNNLRIGVYSKNGTGLSTTNNAALANSSLLFRPNNTSTARLLTLTAVRPVAPTSLKMYNPLVSTTVAVTDISKFIGTTTELTLTAAVSRLASSYSWEIPPSVTIVAGSDLTSNSITINFLNVPAGTASLYLGVKAVNGIGSSVTVNPTTLTPATTSEARLLKVTAIAPSIVGTVTGSLRICPTRASDVVYSIATAATRANTYNVTVPMGCTINGGTTTTATIVATAGATFTVNYPALFIANTTNSIKKIFIQSENGFGVSITNKTLSLTNVSAVCTPKLANSSTTPFDVIAYPNPSSSAFTIETSAKGTTSISVYDMQGRIIENKKMNTNTVEIGGNYTSGVYNVILENSGQSKTIRLIKK